MTSVFADEFYQTQKGEAFEKSQCMIHEHSIAGLFYSLLTTMGYQCTDPNRRVWHSAQKTVIVCLSDDFTFSKTTKYVTVDKFFEPSTVVITDNYIQFQSQYTVLRLPDSYFGIFYYIPNICTFAPSKRFNLVVNRLDHTRALILLELALQTGGVQSCLELDHINFNCFDPDSSNQSVQDIRANFLRYQPSTSIKQSQYHALMLEFLDHMPIRNHQFSIEQVHVSAVINLVIESYSNDSVIALSEKTFRALVTPAPWTLFGAQGTVDRLIDLGFDVLADIVDHSYNNISNRNTNKIARYIANSIEIYQKLANMDPGQLKTRCETAAWHNQRLLAEFRSQWPQDFANWLPMAIGKIAGK